MKTGKDIHEQKAAILNAITDVFLKYGNGYDLSVKVSLLMVDVSIFKFSNGKPTDVKKWALSPQSGNPETCYKMTYREIEIWFKSTEAANCA